MVALVLLTIALGLVFSTGCAGSRNPRILKHGGTITYVSSHKVLLEWPRESRYWCGPGNQDLCMGDFVNHVCPETMPALGSIVNRVELVWDKPRKCWKWSGQ